MKKSSNIIIVICLLLVVPILHAKVAISKIEYYQGQDFVQLYFQTNRIIPIPDVLYPEKNNLQTLVMRINNSEFKVDRNRMVFDSPVIKELTITPAETYCDVGILLKEAVNYRIFTNQNGLYIEFPVVKEVMAKAEVTKPKVGFEKSGEAPPVSRSQTGVSFREVKIADTQKDRVQFEVVLTGQADYTVIPIVESPSRLAIDLKNVQAGKLFRPMNVNNVKAIRGAYHSPSVYRLVFDLVYLKYYSVTAKNNSLLVELADSQSATTLAKNSLPQNEIKSQKEIPAASQPAKSEVKTQAVVSRSPGNEPKSNPEPNRAAKPKEFFPAEKSKAENESLSKGGFITLEDEKGNAQTTFLKQTVEEGMKRYTGEPMSFTFKDSDLVNVLKAIAKIANLNLLIDPGVTGKITCELEKVPWDQALELFLKINGLDMVLEGNILRIGRVESLAREAQRRKELREAKEQEANLEVFTRTLSYARATAIRPILEKQLSSRGEIIVDDRTNTLIISEVPQKIQILDKLIDTLDAANPQVSIEARIVESKTSFEKSLGIQWGYNVIADTLHGNQTSLRFPANFAAGGSPSTGGYVVNLPSPSAPKFSNVFSFGNIANTFNLDVTLSALEKDGKVRIISSPKVTTQNNMLAEITQGTQVPIQTIQNNTVTVRYVPAALELKATPQITAKGTIIMTLDIQNNAPDWSHASIYGPAITTQSTKCSVMVNDGGTFVIGGIYQLEDDITKERVPLLGRIPLIGGLFRSSKKVSDHKELLVFITPRILK